MSCIYKRGQDCFLHFDGLGVPDTCICEHCELWNDEDEEESEDDEEAQ